jgi:glutaredoxin
MKTLIAFIALLLTSSIAGAGMSPPADGAGSVLASQTTIAKKDRFNGTVEVYVTSWCRFCRQALDYLKSNGIRHVAYDIEKDSAARQKYEDLGGQGVPFIVIGSNKMSGYSREALEYYLENSR